MKSFRVLITAHTHSAVDNLLKRVLPLLSADIKEKTFRIGHQSKMASEVICVAEDRFLPLCKDGRDLNAIYDKAQLIAGTCMGVSRHPLLIRNKVDFALVDEAAQVPEPIVIGALMHARQFVLVGDPCQLPPLIRSKESKRGGAAVSLMERLAAKYPATLRQLNKQYRFNQELTDLANHLTYEGKMEAAESIKNAKLFTLFKKWNLRSMKTEWLKKAVNPMTSIAFINTQGASLNFCKLCGSPKNPHLNKNNC